MASTRGKVVTVTWPDYDATGEDHGRALERAGLRLRLAPKLGARTSEELSELVADAFGAIVSTDPFDAAVLTASPVLRVIARVGVGVDSIDLEAATARGVAVTITPGANEEAVAEHTVAMILALRRRLREHDDAVRQGRWERTGAHLPWALAGSTVGLVGYGRIGRLVARRLRCFDARVLVADPVPAADSEVAIVGLDELLERSDVVSLHAPLDPSTIGLIGAAELARMRPGAMLVNTARGGILDEDALLDALRAGHLRAAGLDVFAHEPPIGHPLLTLPNVILTPHTAGLSVRSVDEMTRRATASIVDVARGRRPRDVVNPAVFDHPHFAEEAARA